VTPTLVLVRHSLRRVRTFLLVMTTVLAGFQVLLALAAAELERRARAASPPVIGTVKAGHFRLDPRTLTESEVGMAAAALAKAFLA
jgi:hypothetical protein